MNLNDLIRMPRVPDSPEPTAELNNTASQSTLVVGSKRDEKTFFLPTAFDVKLAEYVNDHIIGHRGTGEKRSTKLDGTGVAQLRSLSDRLRSFPPTSLATTGMPSTDKKNQDPKKKEAK